ncbi:MAG: substrate-binding domain-containing protein [Pseudobutyrivibrio sp.]|nr:substrate-binding domain-containing protein [Pseudobutyrivibrio sp.]
MRNKKLFVGFIMAVALLLTAETYIYVNNTNLKKEPVNISFVLTGDNMDQWENLTEGASTAALDEDCLLDFVNSPVEYGIDGEIDLIERQLNDGADYVVVASSDYEAMKDYVRKNLLWDRVIFVKNGNYKQDKNSIMADDAAIAKDFSDYIKADNKGTKFIMVTTLEDANTKTLREQIEAKFKDSNIDVEYRLMSATSGTLNQSMYNLGQSGLYDGFITLDFETMAAAARAQEKLNSKVLVYSIDNSKEAVYYLDSNAINAIAFKDDYTMGYKAVKEVLSSGTKIEDSDDKLYYIVNKDLIHTEKMEKVLFPFVK